MVWTRLSTYNMCVSAILRTSLLILFDQERFPCGRDSLRSRQSSLWRCSYRHCPHHWSSLGRLGFRWYLLWLYLDHCAFCASSSTSRLYWTDGIYVWNCVCSRPAAWRYFIGSSHVEMMLLYQSSNRSDHS